MAVGGLASELHRLGEAAPDLVEHQADERPRAVDVARRHDEVEADRRVGVHEVGDAEVARRRVPGDDRVAVEAEARHRGGDDAGELVLALVEHLARGLRDERDAGPSAGGASQSIRSRVSICVRAGSERNGRDAGERLVGFGVEDVEDRAAEQAVGRRLPVVARLLLAGRVDEDVGDVLGVRTSREALSDLEERVEADRVGGRRLEAPRRGRTAAASPR